MTFNVACNYFSKRSFFIKFVDSLMIVKNNPLLTIFNDDPSLTTVNIFINKKVTFFQKLFFFKQSFKKRSLIVFIETVVIRFLKIQTSGSFFPKTKQSFFKTIGKRNKKRSFSKTINNPKPVLIRHILNRMQTSHFKPFLY